MLPLWGVYCFEKILVPARWAGLRYIGPLGRNLWANILFPVCWDEIRGLREGMFYIGGYQEAVDGYILSVKRYPQNSCITTYQAISTGIGTN